MAGAAYAEWSTASSRPESFIDSPPAFSKPPASQYITDLRNVVWHDGALHVHVRPGDNESLHWASALGGTLPAQAMAMTGVGAHPTDKPGVLRLSTDAPLACDSWSDASVFFFRAGEMSLFHVYAEWLLPLAARMQQPSPSRVLYVWPALAPSARQPIAGYRNLHFDHFFRTFGDVRPASELFGSVSDSACRRGLPSPPLGHGRYGSGRYRTLAQLHEGGLKPLCERVCLRHVVWGLGTKVVYTSTRVEAARTNVRQLRAFMMGGALAAAADSGETATRRVFILRPRPRGKAGTRFLANSAEVIQSLGCDVVMSDFSVPLTQQLATLSTASVLVGLHGAATKLGLYKILCCFLDFVHESILFFAHPPFV